MLSCSLDWSYVNALISTNHKEKQVVVLVVFLLGFLFFCCLLLGCCCLFLFFVFLGGLWCYFLFVCLFMSCLEFYCGF